MCDALKKWATRLNECVSRIWPQYKYQVRARPVPHLANFCHSRTLGLWRRHLQPWSMPSTSTASLRARCWPRPLCPEHSIAFGPGACRRPRPRPLCPEHAVNLDRFTRSTPPSPAPEHMQYQWVRFWTQIQSIKIGSPIISWPLDTWSRHCTMIRTLSHLFDTYTVMIIAICDLLVRWCLLLFARYDARTIGPRLKFLDYYLQSNDNHIALLTFLDFFAFYFWRVLVFVVDFELHLTICLIQKF
jgi:hypothetical protein